MPYLISDISDDSELLPVNAALSNPTYPLFYDLASETIKVLAGANTTEWQVARGVGNTQAVRHSRGTPLILNANPYSGGEAGVTVTDPLGASFAATGIQVGHAIDLGSGSIGARPAIVDDANPGAVGAGVFWLQTDINGSFVQLHCRNAADDDWIDVTPIFVTQAGNSRQTWDSPDGASELSLSGTGIANDWASDASIAIRRYSPNVRFVIDGDGYHMQDLPTSDPAIAGVLWNSAGTVKVSAG